MSGEAGLIVTSKLFSLALLSGMPVSGPTEAAPVEARLRARYAPLSGKVEAVFEEQRVALALAPLEPDARVPSIGGTIIEDRPGTRTPDRDPLYFKAGKHLRAAIRVGARVRSSGEGFNLRFDVTARVRRTQLDALLRAVAAVLFPAARPEELDVH